MLSRELDIKVREKIWIRDLNLGIVSIEMVFNGLVKVTSVLLEKKSLRMELPIHLRVSRLEDGDPAKEMKNEYQLNYR